MAIIHLNQSYIDHITEHLGDKLKDQFCDSEIRGLLVEASKSGRANFYLRYKSTEGKTSYSNIGKTTEISLADARKKALEIKAANAKGCTPQDAQLARQKDLTFSEFFEEFYLPYVKPRKRSWIKDEQLFRLYLRGEFGHQKLKQMSRQTIQSFHTSLEHQGLSASSANHNIKLLRHALNLAVDWEMLVTNPAAKIPLFDEDNQIERYMNDAELERLLAVLQTDGNRPICLIALFLLSTGARLNEALSATWSQISRQQLTWRIPASNTKANRVRSVPLNPSAIDVLNQLGTEGEHDSLFVNRKTGRPYANIHKVWERLRDAAGLPNLRIHDLRHQYASFLVNSGRTLYEVQQILGHSDSKVTQRYAHLSTKSLQAAANSASVIINGAMGNSVELMAVAA